VWEEVGAGAERNEPSRKETRANVPDGSPEGPYNPKEPLASSSSGEG
jgi:hypothetical protein